MHLADTWHQFHTQAITDKLPLFTHHNRLFDILYAQQFDQSTLSQLFTIADRIRAIAKTERGMRYLKELLNDKRAMLFFVQPSTRTFMSFLNACHILGIQTSEIRDASTSSEIKGESPEDSIRTFSSYVDLIITRHHDEGFAEKAAWVLNVQGKRKVPVINGGSGKDQHPTQALLDMYTINRAFKDQGAFSGKTYAMIGDLKRGRTVRSLTQLLALYEDVSFRFISPKEYTIGQDIQQFLNDRKIPFTLTDSLEKGIKGADAIYATRLQDEYDVNNESKDTDFSSFHLTEKHLPLLKEHCIIMHPFPRRNEISLEIDKDPRALYWKQARNGMWIRAALILYLFGREDRIGLYT